MNPATILAPFTLGMLITAVQPLLAQEAVRREFMIVSVHGQTRLWQMPAEWTPEFRDDHLLLANGERMRLDGIAAIRPKPKDETDGYHKVTLLFPVRTGKSLPVQFLVPIAFPTIADAPLQGDFHKLDPHTFVRRGSYR